MLWRPFVAALVVIFIHGYLGIHVIARRVIFVDIALAQIAAMGAMLGVLQGFEPGSVPMILFSMGFAVFAAGVFAVTRTREEHVPQEAVIGLSYAIAAAAAILIASKAPHGDTHLNQLMAGNVLFARWDQIWKAAIVYGTLLAIHAFLGRRFLLISERPEEAYAQGMNVRLWDFLFYATFAIAITHSVQIVGVLLVFCYLVAPAVFAVMFAQSFWSRLILGWTMAIVVSALGLVVGYDYPTSPSIMCVFAFFLIGGGVVKTLVGSPHRLRTGATIAVIGVCLVFGFWAVFHYIHPGEEAHDHEHAEQGPHVEEPEHPVGSSPAELRKALQDRHPGVRQDAAQKLGEMKDRASAPALAKLLESETSAGVREKVAVALDQIGAPESAPGLLRAYAQEEDDWVRLRMAQALAHLGCVDGVGLLLSLSRDCGIPRVRHTALDSVMAVSGAENEKILDELTGWWEKNKDRLVWDPHKKAFVPR